MKKVTVVFNREYEIELPNHEPNEYAVIEARERFNLDLQLLSAKNNDFSIEIKNVEQIKN